MGNIFQKKSNIKNISKSSPKSLLKISQTHNKIVNNDFIKNKYKILKKLGTGLSGTVYLV